MGLLKIIGLGSSNKVNTALVKPPVKSSWLWSMLTSMNATEDCVVLQSGKRITHKVPQFFWINKAIQWAYDKNRVAKSGIAGLLQRTGVSAAKLGFRFLQLPMIKAVSPLMQGNLLFSLYSATIGSVFKLATGNVTGAVHNAIGAGAAIFGTAAAAKYLPLAMGMNPLGAGAAALGLALTMIVEPKIRRFMGLDREVPRASNEIDPRILAQMAQMQQQQALHSQAGTQNPYQQQSSQALAALSGGQPQYSQNPYGYYANPYGGMPGYYGAMTPGTSIPNMGMAGYGYPNPMGAQDPWALYYQQQQQQQIQQAKNDMEAQRVLADVTSKFKGYQQDSAASSSSSYHMS